jgi:hypothetical protein
VNAGSELVTYAPNVSFFSNEGPIKRSSGLSL